MRAMNSTDAPIAGQHADEILSKAEAATRLKVSIRTLDAWMRIGRVPYLKIGKTVRFRWPDVLKHLNQNARIH